jgi:hypothetical protein
MRLIYRETGGVAGLRKGLDIDAANLPEEAAADLKALIAEQDRQAASVPEPAAGPARDRETAMLWLVDDAGQHHALAAAGRPIPDAFRRLFGWLSRNAAYDPMRK